MRSASALTRHCAYVTKLSKARPRSPYVMATADEGTRFGALVQDLIEGRTPTEPEIVDDVWDDYTIFRDQWLRWPMRPGSAVCEFAMGLSRAGDYVPVVEIYPHFYVPSHTVPRWHEARPKEAYFLPAAGDQADLATGGRLDVGWVNGDVAIVLDMKRSAFKYGEPEYVPQLMALGCAWALANGCKYVQTGLYGKRDGVFVWAQEIQRVSDILPDVLEMAMLPEDLPMPGDHCQSCYERRDCKPGRELYPIRRRG